MNQSINYAKPICSRRSLSGFALALSFALIFPATAKPPEKRLYSIATVDEVILHSREGLSARQQDAFEEISGPLSKVLGEPKRAELCLGKLPRADVWQQLIALSASHCEVTKNRNTGAVIDADMICKASDPDNADENVLVTGRDDGNQIELTYTLTGGRENVAGRTTITASRGRVCSAIRKRTLR